jgi:hypothetical protein
VDTANPGRSTLRLEAGYTAATIGGALPIESGGAASVFWTRYPVGIGLSYLLFPAASVETSDTSLSITRHSAVALFRLAHRASGGASGWELGGAAGPLVDIWLRSTQATRGTPAPPASTVDAGVTVRADATYWLSPLVGVQTAFAVEVAPWRPEFQGPSGPVLDPAVARARAAFGVAAALP